MKKRFLKPIIASLLALVIPLGLVTTAFAEDTTQQVEFGAAPNPADITLTSTNWYKVEIPATYTLTDVKKSSTAGQYAYAQGTVKVLDKVLAANTSVRIGVDGNNSYDLTNAASATPITYGIYSTGTGGTIADSTNLLTVSGTEGETIQADCYVGVDRSQILYAGDYTGQLTFTVSIVTN